MLKRIFNWFKGLFKRERIIESSNNNFKLPMLASDYDGDTLNVSEILQDKKE